MPAAAGSSSEYNAGEHGCPRPTPAAKGRLEWYLGRAGVGRDAVGEAFPGMLLAMLSQPCFDKTCRGRCGRFVTPPPSEGVVSQSGAPWGVVSNKLMCGVWCIIPCLARCGVYCELASQPASRPARTANLSQYRFSIFPHLEKIVFFLIPRGGGDFSRALVNKLPPSPHPASSSQPRPLTTTAPLLREHPSPPPPLTPRRPGLPKL